MGGPERYYTVAESSSLIEALYGKREARVWVLKDRPVVSSVGATMATYTNNNSSPFHMGSVQGLYMTTQHNIADELSRIRLEVQRYSINKDKEPWERSNCSTGLWCSACDGEHTTAEPTYEQIQSELYIQQWSHMRDTCPCVPKYFKGHINDFGDWTTDGQRQRCERCRLGGTWESNHPRRQPQRDLNRRWQQETEEWYNKQTMS